MAIIVRSFSAVFNEQYLNEYKRDLMSSGTKDHLNLMFISKLISCFAKVIPVPDFIIHHVAITYLPFFVD